MAEEDEVQGPKKRSVGVTPRPSHDFNQSIDRLAKADPKAARSDLIKTIATFGETETSKARNLHGKGKKEG